LCARDPSNWFQFAGGRTQQVWLWVRATCGLHCSCTLIVTWQLPHCVVWTRMLRSRDCRCALCCVHQHLLGRGSAGVLVLGSRVRGCLDSMASQLPHGTAFAGMSPGWSGGGASYSIQGGECGVHCLLQHPEGAGRTMHCWAAGVPGLHSACVAGLQVLVPTAVCWHCWLLAMLD
jgi:hypothetical protein